MRILLVAHGFPPEAVGGTEIYVGQLARALRDGWGDQIFVFARQADAARPELSVQEDRVAGVEVVRVNNTFRSVASFEQSYRNAGIRAIAGRFVERVQPDVAHVHHLTGLSTDLLEELALRGVPTIVTLHDYWLFCQRGQLLDLDYRRCAGPWPEGCARCLRTGREQAEERRRHVLAMCGHVSRFLAPSRTLRERFVEFGIDPTRVISEDLGVDHRPLQGSPRASSGRLRLGFVGSLMISKAPHLLLEAHAGMAPGMAAVRVFGSHVAYHGDGRYQERLEPLLRGAGVEHLGPVAHERIGSAFASIDVLVVPSTWIENAPLVIKEAFVAGVPVVASDLGGMAELVAHERNGLLFRAGDVSDLRVCLERLAREPGLLDRLRAGLPRVTSIEENARRLREVYATAREA